MQSFSLYYSVVSLFGEKLLQQDKKEKKKKKYEKENGKHNKLTL